MFYATCCCSTRLNSALPKGIVRCALHSPAPPPPPPPPPHPHPHPYQDARARAQAPAHAHAHTRTTHKDKLCRRRTDEQERRRCCRGCHSAPVSGALPASRARARQPSPTERPLSAEPALVAFCPPGRRVPPPCPMRAPGRGPRLRTPPTTPLTTPAACMAARSPRARFPAPARPRPQPALA